MQTDSGTTGPSDLEDALLELIFSLVCLRGQEGPAAGPPAYRPNSALPQVCRRWNEVYTQSCALWAHLSMDWSEVLEELLLQGAHTLIPRFGYASKWVSDRAPYISALSYSGCGVLGPSLEQQLFRVCRAAVRLRSMQLGDLVHSADGVLAQLAECPSLQDIGLFCQRTTDGPIQQLSVSATALGGLSRLATLRSLTLNVDKVVGTTRDIADSLSQLTLFRFVGRREAVVLHPEFLNTLSNLRHLELSNCRLGQFTPRTAEALSHVTFLGVSDVLAAKPRKKSGTTLWEGLRYLDSLQQLSVREQDFGSMPASALDCTGLRGLTLVRSAADDWPGPNHLLTQPNCLSIMESLHLGDLRLEQPIHAQFWHSLVSLTKLVWSDLQLLATDQQHPGPMLVVHQAMPTPPELSRLLTLRALSLEYAQLDAVPQAVQVLTGLRRLSLEGNAIQSLPEGHYLTGIEHLNLAANALKSLPEGLRACRSLRTLSLARNPDINLTLEDVGPLVGACPQLERVHVTECNGLLMGMLLEEQPGPEVELLERVQGAHPRLLAWGDDRAAWT